MRAEAGHHSVGGRHPAIAMKEDAILALLALVHIWAAPYTKVEESFNVQATHDFLYVLPSNLFGGGGGGSDAATTTTVTSAPSSARAALLAGFDHYEFPGVVPRTCLGALALSVAALPAKLAVDALGLPKAWTLLAVRACLAAAGWLALRRLKRAVARQFGRQEATCFVAVVCTQFHLLFYLGRPLPNTFALALCTAALAEGVDRRWRRAVPLLVGAAVVFRCDVVLLLGPLALWAWAVDRDVTLGQLVRWGAGAGLASLAATVAADSLFWGRWLWPEGEVFFYNAPVAGLDRSSDWGTQPLLWYFSTALPKALLGALLLVPAGLFQAQFISRNDPLLRGVDARLAALVGPVVLYVGLFSLLPHKEVRFVFPALPALDVAAGVGLARLLNHSPNLATLLRSKDGTLRPEAQEGERSWTPSGKKRRAARAKAKAKANRRSAWLPFFAAAVAVGALAASFVVACAFLRVSAANYPGGDAFRALHADVHGGGGGGGPVAVHIDVAAAQQGVSRYGEARPGPGQTYQSQHAAGKPPAGGAGWRYSKAEGLVPGRDGDAAFLGFDYLLTGDPAPHTDSGAFEVAAAARGFPRIKLGLPPFVETRDAIFVLRRVGAGEGRGKGGRKGDDDDDAASPQKGEL